MNAHVPWRSRVPSFIWEGAKLYLDLWEEGKWEFQRGLRC